MYETSEETVHPFWKRNSTKYVAEFLLLNKEAGINYKHIDGGSKMKMLNLEKLMPFLS